MKIEKNELFLIIKNPYTYIYYGLSDNYIVPIGSFICPLNIQYENIRVIQKISDFSKFVEDAKIIKIGFFKLEDVMNLSSKDNLILDEIITKFLLLGKGFSILKKLNTFFISIKRNSLIPDDENRELELFVFEKENEIEFHSFKYSNKSIIDYKFGSLEEIIKYYNLKTEGEVKFKSNPSLTLVLTYVANTI